MSMRVVTAERRYPPPEFRTRLSFGRYSRIISASPTSAKLARLAVRRQSRSSPATTHRPAPRPHRAPLHGARDRGSSGTKIADEISVSRSEVWRLIQQLRGLGVDVAGHPATGYSLRQVPDLLLPEILRPLLRGTIFDKHIHHFYKIGSTNTAAMSAAAEGSPEGSVFLAEEQTSGRGRGANTWQSPRSTGIYCSLIVRPSLPPSEVLLCRWQRDWRCGPRFN